ncbi:hypothetical protein ITJ55_07060 [Frigoribacterium sp. VKM Ac-1396]|uniref:hypothetical protein n=1 Tax=Frigoribacterium sp. VKM Ac-1396 TaxID=2783821 RepID=UPI00188D1592|nr:hypothetical protein [Frigoribacterium sp. VKM Ac-1396]MBF4600565.1 hypothetical protein [Frigoribacterium sp. VKM Ac-1396]
MITIRPTPAGLEADIVGPWTKADERKMRKRGITGLVLNYAHGYQERNLDFISGLQLERLIILSRTTSDHEPIYDLADTLIELNITTDPRLEVDLTRLPRLKELGADWRQVRDTIGAVDDLDSVCFGLYTEADLLPLAHLHSLSRLTLLDRPRIETVTGLSELPRLRFLEIASASHLRDITELAWNPTPLLESLSFAYSANVSDLESIAHTTSLTQLTLSDMGTFVSLAPLVRLRRLERLFLHGSTNVSDGDLTPLLDLPALKLVSLANRRHYSPPASIIRSQIASRPG